MFQKLKKIFHDFRHTLHAGYYKPITGNEDIEIESNGTHLPSRGEFSIGLGALTIAYAVITDVFLNIAEAASTMIVTFGAGAAALTGVAVVAHLYYTCRKASRDVITEINAAGQTVRGTRDDLYTLHQAQRKIFSLTSEFENAAPLFMIEKEVNTILRKTEAICQRVDVLDKNDDHVIPDETYTLKRLIVSFSDATRKKEVTSTVAAPQKYTTASPLKQDQPVSS